MLDNITFQRRFAVDQRRNDIAVVHLFGVFQNHNVTIKNVSADHGVAADAQGKRAAIFYHICRAHIERDVTFNCLLG